jgi:hypothetical protein
MKPFVALVLLLLATGNVHAEWYCYRVADDDVHSCEHRSHSYFPCSHDCKHSCKEPRS